MKKKTMYEFTGHQDEKVMLDINDISILIDNAASGCLITMSSGANIFLKNPYEQIALMLYKANKEE